MVKVLAAFGFYSLGLTEVDFLKKDFVTQLGCPPLRIDILNTISGVEFADAYLNRIIGEVDGLMVNFINIPDFIKNKEAIGRPKDLGNITAIKKGKN